MKLSHELEPAAALKPVKASHHTFIAVRKIHWSKKGGKFHLIRLWGQCSYRDMSTCGRGILGTERLPQRLCVGLGNAM